MKNSLAFSHQLIEEVITPGDTVLDGTAGNGHDTLFLAQLVGSRGCVYAFDLQEKAITHTKMLLEAHGAASQVHLFQRSHAELGQVIAPDSPIKGALFNLGYLPGGDKTIITKKESTLTAIRAVLPRLARGGRCVIVLYWGHPGGKEEKEAVLAFAAALPQAHYQAAVYQFINQRHTPPLLLCIEKIAKK
ncbi:class I SAM-dependent methyltransferase [Enterococcus hirae]|nr:class I SAM-dependent methyltransferase [Enterococcus hirae]